MSTLKAVVRSGQLTLDEPTELPEGTVLALEEVDAHKHLDTADELDD